VVLGAVLVVAARRRSHVS